jgi:hypothetical protein
MNGIPVIVTASGGNPEMQAGAGLQITLPEALHLAPYQRLPSDDALEPVMREIERLFDDEDAYQALSYQALEVASRDHDLATNAHKLATAMRSLIAPLS